MRVVVKNFGKAAIVGVFIAVIWAFGDFVARRIGFDFHNDYIAIACAAASGWFVARNQSDEEDAP